MSTDPPRGTAGPPPLFKKRPRPSPRRTMGPSWGYAKTVKFSLPSPPTPPPPPFWGWRYGPRPEFSCCAEWWRRVGDSFFGGVLSLWRGEGSVAKKKNDFCELSGNMAGENANFSDKNVGKFWILGLGVISVVYFVMVCQKNDFYNHFSAFIWCFLVILLMSRKIFWRFSVILTPLVKQFDVFGCFRFFLSLKCVQKGAAACWWVRLQRWYQTKVLFHVFNVFK